MSVFPDRPRTLLVILTILGCVGLANATTAVIPADVDLMIGARAIVRAKVLSTGCSFDQRRGAVFTYISLEVKEVFKGRLPGKRIVIKEPGGQAGNRISLIFGTPQFTQGEDVLLYLDSWPDGSLRVHQMFLGKFSIRRDTGTGQLLVERDTRGAHVEMLAAGAGATDAPGGAATSSMELSEYVKMLRARIAANQDRSREFEARWYSNRPLISEPPELVEMSSHGAVEPQFHLLSPDMRWFEPDDGQPVVFDVNMDGAPNSQVIDDIAAAAQAWSTIPGSSLRVAIGNTISGCLTQAPRSLVSFNNCGDIFSPASGCSGILGLGGISAANTLVSKVVNGTSFYQATQGFISLNPYAATCLFGDHCSVQELMTHEMGHALGLHHSWDPIFGGAPSAADTQATMYYMAHFDGRCASIKTDDVNAMTFVYPGAGSGPPGPLGITSLELRRGYVGAPYSQILSASGGIAPYVWSLAPASAPLPAGLNLGLDGTISGVPSAAGAFSFNVQVEDSEGAISQAGLTITISPLPGALAAQFVSQSVPVNVLPGASFIVTMTWDNIGTEPWGEGTGIRLGPQNPPNNSTWGGERIIFPGGITVPPNVRVTFPFTVFAPATPGSYNFQWQMVKEGVGFFGDLSDNVLVLVGPPPPPLAVATASLPSVDMGATFRAKLEATGGVPPYTWGILSGALPPGLGLATSTGVISGSPSAMGSFSFAITVTDESLATAAKTFLIQVSTSGLQPQISAMRYKSGNGKLIVRGNNFDGTATLLIDGRPVAPTTGDVGVLVVKRLFLVPGAHQVEVVTPDGTTSPPAVLTVN